MSDYNRSRLFTAACFALLTTAFAFGIRAGIMNDLSVGMSLDDKQLGWIQFMGIFGFPIATVVGGPLYNSLGPKKLGWIAFVAHILGITFSIASASFYPLFFSTFFISFGNGIVEAAYNPLIAQMYPDNKATMLNRFHVWFPGGIAIGSILVILINSFDGSWQLKMALMYVPALIYLYLFWGQKFPDAPKTVGSSTKENVQAIATSPLFWLMVILMTLTATTELGTQSWVERIFGATSGVNPLLVLALITGIMAVGRSFAGPVIHRLNITGVLLASAIITIISIYLMSTASGGMVYFAAILFAIGVCYFWPNMISFVAEYLPKTGALGMSLIGGAGMLGLSIFQPIIGGWLQSNKGEIAGNRGMNDADYTALSDQIGSLGSADVSLPALQEALANGETTLSGFNIAESIEKFNLFNEIELAAGQATLGNIAWFPMIVAICFIGLFIFRKKFDNSEAH